MNKDSIKAKSLLLLTKNKDVSLLFGSNIIPNKNQGLRDRVFFLYVLEKNGFFNIPSFRSMVKELKNFNEQLISGCQIKNFVRVYYLYKSLYERMNQISVLCKNSEQAKTKSNQIQQWFFQSKEKITQIKKTENRLMMAKEDLIQNQNLRKTMSNIKTKRQNEVYQIMSKSSYSQFFQSKQSNFRQNGQPQQTQQKNYQTFSQKSQTFPKFKSVSKISNLTKTSTNLNHRKTFSTNFDQQSTDSKKLQSSNKLKWSISTKPIKKNSTFYMANDLIKKDKQMQEIDAPDNINFKVQKKSDFDLHEEKYIKNQKIKYLNEQGKLKSEVFLKTNQNKKSASKKDFISLNKQIIKFRQQKSRFRLQVNRKIQSHRYLSQLSQRNMIKKNKMQNIESNCQNIVKQINLKFQNIPQIESNKLVNSNITFQIKSQSSPKQVSAKYLNHLHKKSQKSQENYQSDFESQQFKSQLTGYKNSSHLNPEEPIISLTDYKAKLAWKSKKTLPIIRAIQQNSIENYNVEARENAFVLKNKLVKRQVALQCHKINGGLRINVDKLIQKNKQFQGVKKNLFSNPFFVIKKVKTKKVKGKKQK